MRRDRGLFLDLISILPGTVLLADIATWATNIITFYCLTLKHPFHRSQALRGSQFRRSIIPFFGNRVGWDIV